MLWDRRTSACGREGRRDAPAGNPQRKRSGADRFPGPGGADISRLRCRGVNLSYLSPCGYVGPAYYESEGAGWLKSFTAGFLTTCGLRVVGSPCVDEREPHSEIWIMRLFLE